MSPTCLVRLARELQRLRPDLNHAQRAEIAVKIAHANGVSIDTYGNACFSDAARAIEPALGHTDNTQIEARIARKAPKAATPAGDDEMATIDAMPATTPRERALRAYEREKIIAVRVGYKSTPEQP